MIYFQEAEYAKLGILGGWVKTTLFIMGGMVRDPSHFGESGSIGLLLCLS